MNVEKYAKALTAMEAHVSIHWHTEKRHYEAWLPSFESQTYRLAPMTEFTEGFDIPADYASACDALSLPWQQHPVWKMWELLEAIDKAECYESALSIGLAADVRAFVASAKGGG